MIRSLLAAVLIAAAVSAWADELPIRPDPVLTPGVVASTDESEVCGRVNGLTYSQRHRKTTAAMKAEVFRRYGIDPETARQHSWEIDHRVELAIGGADDVRNLWPESGETHPNFHDKDRLEAEVWRRVCVHHTMTLAEGQAIFLGDWIEGYTRIFGAAP